MTKPRLWRRMTLAVVLMAGFYLLALSIAALLLYLPVAEWRMVGRVTPQLLVFCAIGAIAILVGITPRLDRFVDPGPTLDPARHPRLFAVINDTAAATSQSPPVRVYLVSDFNAWVAQRGGIMSLGSERVMGLGLPLLQTLTVDELKAVLAHEFGHFHGGDTKLGPWLFKTRAAIGRTISNLAHRPAFIRKPFELYGNAFLRLTHAVSRQQEFAADALSASVVDVATVRSSLVAIHRLAPAFGPFWLQEVGPALRAGYRPPVLEGWQKFLSAPEISSHLETEFEKALTEGKSDPYDTHPPLKERLEALPHTDATTPAHSPKAITLLDDPAELEAALIQLLAKLNKAPEPQPVSWKDLGDKVWVPLWTSLVGPNRARLEGMTPENVVPYLEKPAELAVRFSTAARADLASPRIVLESQVLWSAAVTLGLLQHGFLLSAEPGHAVCLTRGELNLKPFSVWEAVEKKEMSPAEWVSLCHKAGVAGLDLAAVVPPAK